MMLIFQLIGLAALILDVLSVQFRRREHILVVQIIASITWVIHFFLIGAIAGAAMNSVGIVRSLAYYRFRGKHRPRWILWSIIGLSVLVTAVIWQGPVSLLPMFAMVIAAVGLWQRGEQKIRLILLACVPFWFAYNLIFGSYAGMASDSIAVVSTLVALYRYRLQGFNPAADVARS